MTALNVGFVESNPANVTVGTEGPEPYRYEVLFPGLVVNLSAAAAEALVDGLIEALTAGGDRHEQPPF